MTVGENIRRIRKEKGLTQKQLGERLNMTQSAIGQFENDKTSPKIETVDKIASALGVNIVDIMEQFTIEQYKTTSEYQKLEKSVYAQEGIIAILTDIYGKVENKYIEGQYGSGDYYLVGEGEKQFILYDGDIDALYKSTKASIPALVERMKDSRPEKEVVREYLKQLDIPISGDQIPDRFK
ncbi:MAG: helix-turn-helix domain-containing protein [Muricoprocola sp.]